MGAILALCATTVISSPAQTFKTVVTFDTINGKAPDASLVQGRDGNLYGTTTTGSYSDTCQNNDGNVFKITPKGAFAVVYCFSGTGDAAAALVLGTDGNFYGTTNQGGADDDGTFFKITPSGTLTMLHNLKACCEGQPPYESLLQGTDGNFYGIAGAGGKFSSGAVFKITPAGTLTTVYSFCSQTHCTDGQSPQAGLVQGPDGNFYGTTLYGGAGSTKSPCAPGCGTIFRLTPGGRLTTLYRFCAQANCPDGFWPTAALVAATDGNLYGTTLEGGDSTCDPPQGCGTVFRITPTGALETLHVFENAEGNQPVGLLQGNDGNFYGTAQYGGRWTYGSVFDVRFRV